ncbi:MAG: hypothetical protein K0R29_2218 [Pseudobdellovibrio sp.]|jgi:hypothetical protein|nr:hypothetical protein [Pseudobdellovibrio sp.]
MKRRNLLLSIYMIPATLALATVLTACDQDSGGNGSNNQGQAAPNPSPAPAPGPGPTPGAGQACLNGATSTVLAGGNPSHSHGSTTISSADVSAGATRSYDVPAENGHTHTFQLQATHFAMMRANGSASVSTRPDANGHFHAVTVICN